MDIFSFKVEQNNHPAVLGFKTDGVVAIHHWLERLQKNQTQTTSLLLVLDDVCVGTMAFGLAPLFRRSRQIKAQKLDPSTLAYKPGPLSS